MMPIDRHVTMPSNSSSFDSCRGTVDAFGVVSLEDLWVDAFWVVSLEDLRVDAFWIVSLEDLRQSLGRNRNLHHRYGSFGWDAPDQSQRLPCDQLPWH